ALVLAERSLLADERGNFAAAGALAREARDAMEEARLDDYAFCSLVHAATGQAAVRAGDLRRANLELARSRLLLDATRPLPWLFAQLSVELVRAQLLLS